MEIYCESCGRRLEPDELDLETATAKCRACGADFSIGENIQWRDRALKAERVAGLPQDLPLPRGIRAEKTDWGFRITQRWFAPPHVFIAIFCAIWSSGLVAFYRNLLQDPDSPTLAYLVPIVHVAVGLALGYWALAGLLNKTVISAEQGLLSVRHGPLPWRGRLTLPKAKIEQVYGADHRYWVRRSASRDSATPPQNPRSARSLDLHVLSSDGSDRVILKGLRSPEELLFLERRIEEALRIQDQVVPGEMRVTSGEEAAGPRDGGGTAGDDRRGPGQDREAPG
jgi:hypothetical protein